MTNASKSKLPAYLEEPKSDRRADIDQYMHLRAFERDFDAAQGEMRRAFSYWLIAIFTGMGSVILFLPERSASSAALDLSVFSGLILISWIALLGTLMLWWIDQYTYQGLLHSIFVHGLYIEWKKRDDPTWPRYRSAMYSQNLNVHWKLNAFYMVPAALFFIVLFVGASASLSCFVSGERMCGALVFGSGYLASTLFYSSWSPLFYVTCFASFGLVVFIIISKTGAPLLESYGGIYCKEFRVLQRRDFQNLAQNTYQTDGIELSKEFTGDE